MAAPKGSTFRNISNYQGCHIPGGKPAHRSLTRPQTQLSTVTPTHDHSKDGDALKVRGIRRTVRSLLPLVVDLAPNIAMITAEQQEESSAIREIEQLRSMREWNYARASGDGEDGLYSFTICTQERKQFLAHLEPVGPYRRLQQAGLVLANRLLPVVPADLVYQE